jgi:subtilisin-like proprotein convertase family protein
MIKWIVSLLMILSFNSFYLQSKAQTFSQDLHENNSIPDDGTGLFAKIKVSGLPEKINNTFGLESVCINITHSYDAQLDIYLVAPDGTNVELSTNNGAFGHDYVNTCFTMTATSFVSSVFSLSPFTGNFRPEGDLSKVNNNKNPNGIWSLYIADDIKDGNRGLLVNWSLKFSNTPAIKFPFTSSTLPILSINTNGKPVGDNIKIPARLGIIYSGEKRNHLTDTFNNFNNYIEISIHGSSSRLYPKKSYRFQTIKDPSHKEGVKAKLLDLPVEKDWILEASFNDKSFIRDKLIFDLFKLMGHYSVQSRYVEVLLNNQYQGLYILEEKIKQGKNRVPVSKIKTEDVAGDSLTGGYIFCLNRTKAGMYGWSSKYPSNPSHDSANYFQCIYPDAKAIVQKQKDYIKGVVDQFENSLMQDNFDDPQNGYRKWIDVNSFIDNMIINEVAKNPDAYRLSTYFYKDRDSKNSKIIMGPVWDFDISCGGSKYNEGRDCTGWQYLYPTSENFIPFWWKRFMEDPRFSKELYQRYMTLRKTILDLSSIYKMIDKNASKVNEAQERNFKMWPILGQDVWPNPAPHAETYKEEIQYLKKWFKDRLDWMDKNIAPLCNVAVNK